MLSRSMSHLSDAEKYALLCKRYELFMTWEIEAGRHGSAFELMDLGLKVLERKQKRLNLIRAAVADGLADIAAGRIADRRALEEGLGAAAPALPEGCRLARCAVPRLAGVALLTAKLGGQDYTRMALSILFQRFGALARQPGVGRLRSELTGADTPLRLRSYPHEGHTVVYGHHDPGRGEPGIDILSLFPTHSDTDFDH